MTDTFVRRLRDDLGITQRELADRINQIDPLLRLSATSISRYETGQRTPSGHVQAALNVIAARDELSAALHGSRVFTGEMVPN